ELPKLSRRLPRLGEEVFGAVFPEDNCSNRILALYFGGSITTRFCFDNWPDFRGCAGAVVFFPGILTPLTLGQSKPLFSLLQFYGATKLGQSPLPRSSEVSDVPSYGFNIPDRNDL